jgi:hypothetical protein
VALSACSDILVTDVTFETDFIHEFTVTHRAVGNVFSGPVRAANVDLDHHRDAPFENLFQDLSGDVRMEAGGSKCYGPPAGARNTYWAVDFATEPPAWLGAAAVIERAPNLAPRDLRGAQWRRRRVEEASAAHPSARANRHPLP